MLLQNAQNIARKLKRKHFRKSLSEKHISTTTGSPRIQPEGDHIVYHIIIIHLVSFFVLFFFTYAASLLSCTELICARAVPNYANFSLIVTVIIYQQA